MIHIRGTKGNVLHSVEGDSLKAAYLRYKDLTDAVWPADFEPVL